VAARQTRQPVVKKCSGNLDTGRLTCTNVHYTSDPFENTGAYGESDRHSVARQVNWPDFSWDSSRNEILARDGLPKSRPATWSFESNELFSKLLGSSDTVNN
jgi:hypothetical protein